MEDGVKAEAGMVIGITGLENLVCPKCGELLEWIEYVEDRPVRLDSEGCLIPQGEEKIDIGRASPKEAFCCDVIYKATPWPSFVISSTEDPI